MIARQIYFFQLLLTYSTLSSSNFSPIRFINKCYCHNENTPNCCCQCKGIQQNVTGRKKSVKKRVRLGWESDGQVNIRLSNKKWHTL